MKSNYEKYMKEVWEMKEAVYNDFKKSGCKSYIEFLRKELASMKIAYKKVTISNNIKSS